MRGRGGACGACSYNANPTCTLLVVEAAGTRSSSGVALSIASKVKAFRPPPNPSMELTDFSQPPGHIGWLVRATIVDRLHANHWGSGQLLLPLSHAAKPRRT